MNKASTAYVLWLGCLLNLHGLHRLYNGKIFTGLLWMFSFGLFGVGQIVDLFLIPGMVEKHNAKLRERYSLSQSGVPLIKAEVQEVVRDDATLPGQQKKSQLMVQLLKLAETRGGKLSVAQSVVETGATFAEIETAFKCMLKAGYVEISDGLTRSVVVPEFRPTRNQFMMQLLNAAAARGGRLSVTQAVLATGASFDDVEAALKDMLKTGYVDVGNDPETGVVMYEFTEL